MTQPAQKFRGTQTFCADAVGNAIDASFAVQKVQEDGSLTIAVPLVQVISGDAALTWSGTVDLTSIAEANPLSWSISPKEGMAELGQVVVGVDEAGEQRARWESVGVNPRNCVFYVEQGRLLVSAVVPSDGPCARESMTGDLLGTVVVHVN
jgi:hypothetical protein